MDDKDRALALFGALGGDVPELYVVIPGLPPSKARARVGKGGKFYAPDRSIEEVTAWQLRSASHGQMMGNVALVCIFFRPDYHRIDTDNMLKHVCDSANGVIWMDDVQVTGITGILELDKDHPRTVVMAGHHVSTMLRGDDTSYPCEVCGKPISRYRQKASPVRTCSEKCRIALTGVGSLVAEVSCQRCGSMYRRHTTTQVFCSQACRIDARRWVPKETKPKSKCIDCGIQLDHYRGGRCRDCWRKSLALNGRPGILYPGLD